MVPEFTQSLHNHYANRPIPLLSIVLDDPSPHQDLYIFTRLSSLLIHPLVASKISRRSYHIRTIFYLVLWNGGCAVLTCFNLWYY